MSEPATPEDFGVLIEGVNRGLMRRLHDHALKPAEQEQLLKVEQVAQLEAQGKTKREIAELLGMSIRVFDQYSRRPRYRLLRKHIADKGASEVADSRATIRRQRDRERFDGNTIHALDWFEQAFRRHPKSDPKRDIKVGDFTNMDRAERATKMVAGAQGWLEPIPTIAKPKELAPGVIQAQMSGIRAADQREMVVRVTTPGGETVEVGMRERAGEEAP